MTTGIDPAAGTSGTPEGGDPGTSGGASTEDVAALRAEVEELRRHKETALAQKESLERERERNEALEARLRQESRPAATAGDDGDPYHQLRAQIHEVARIAADPEDNRQAIAISQLATLRATEQMMKQQSDFTSLSRIPAESRDAAYNFYTQNRNRFSDPEAAYYAMLGRQAEQAAKQPAPAAKPEGDGAARKAAAPSTTVGGAAAAPEPAAAAGGSIMTMRRSAYLQALRDGNDAYRDMKDSGKLTLIDG